MYSVFRISHLIEQKVRQAYMYNAALYWWICGFVDLAFACSRIPIWGLGPIQWPQGISAQTRSPSVAGPTT